MKTDKEIIDFAGQISRIYHDEISRLPYSANAIEELHANENAHSRILRMLLEYSGGGTWPVYQSFLKLLKDRCSQFNFDCNSPKFYNEKERIDLLIYDTTPRGTYAIIIENKVQEATDQDLQIERYIDIASSSIPLSNIFVIYLTSDGTKKASSNSLTRRAMRALDFISESESGRYIELNYLKDILPLIEDEVLPIIPIKEDLLMSSVKLYVDYLKGMFNLRGYEKIIHNKIQKTMSDLNINSIHDAVKLRSDLDRLQTEVHQVFSQKAEETLRMHLFEPLSVFLKKYDGKVIGENKYEYEDKFSCTIVIKKWEKLNIRISPEGYSCIYGLCHKNLEEDPISPETRTKIKEVMKGFRTSPWWPIWKELNDLDPNAGTDDIWRSLESGEFLKKFTAWIDYIMEMTKGLKL